MIHTLTFLDTLEKHNDYVKRVTPPGRLYFFDVKEGWGPLCKILDLPVPDEPFPHANDRQQVQREIKKLMKSAVIGWLQIFAVLAAAIAVGIYYLKTSKVVDRLRFLG
jgi:hypothetical protein